MDKQKVVDYIELNKEAFININNKIWDNPEIRFNLEKSADTLIEALENQGFSLERGIADMKDAFVASYGGGKPVIAFLGEYDALPNISQVADLKEKKQLVEGGSGHGCGHHALGTGSLLAAVALKEYVKENNLDATIKFFGCPAEESGSGKAFMARAGVFDGLDAIITWHPMTENKIWGESSLANFQVFFKFKGRSSHAAATPELGRSALDACELMNVGVNYLREHIVQEARVHYAYTDVGGGSPNVVQPTASVLYFIRAPKTKQVKEIYDRIVKIAQGAALMTETELEISWDSAASEYIVNATLAEVMYENMKALGEISYTEDEMEYARGFVDTLDEAAKSRYESAMRSIFNDLSEEELQEVIKSPMLKKLYPLKVVDAAMPGSTDVGDASFNAPTVQLLTASYPVGTAPHSWQWVAAGKSSLLHKGMLYGAKAMAMTAVDLLENPEIIEKAKVEFEKRVGSEGYRNYIPMDVKPQ